MIHPAKAITLEIATTFDAPATNPFGVTGVDLWLLDAKGTVIGSATAGSSPAKVTAAGLDPGVYTLEVSGEAGAVNEMYSGTVRALLPRVTPPAEPGSLFATGSLPPAPGVGLKGANEDAEPGLSVDGDGTFWVASDISPSAANDKRALAAVSGSDVWRSTDDGKTWAWVASPFDGSPGSPGLGGEDTDIAVAPVKNPNGFYNVYVASLWVGSSNIAVSKDGGATWTVTAVNGLPVQDRPWLSADGPCIFYMSYHATVPYDTVVNRYNACDPSDQAIGSAVDPNDTALFAGNIAPGLTNRFGKQVVDNSPSSPHQHRIYVPMEGCSLPTSNGIPQEGSGCQDVPHMFVGYSDDGVQWHNSDVAPVATKQLLIWPDTITTDAAGNVYLAWFDTKHSYVAMSSDGGGTWGKPVQIDAAPALASVYPTLAASKPGHLTIAYYGATRAGDPMDGAVMGPPNSYGAANWQLFLTESNDYGKTWTQTTVTPTIHTGVLCYEGGGCGAFNGDRNLLDDFGLAISPKTGTTVIAFDNDQPGGLTGNVHTDFARSLPVEAPARPATHVLGKRSLPATGLADDDLDVMGIVLLALAAVCCRKLRAPGPHRSEALRSAR